MTIKKLLIFSVLLLILLCGCANLSKGPDISFSDTDFSDVNSIVLTNLHNGKQTYIEDAESVEEICEFISCTTGKNGTSAKGYYEGTYAVALYANKSASLAILDSETPILSVAFGDTSSFYYGELEEGTPARYSLASSIIEEVVSFFKQYDQYVIADSEVTP